MRYVSLFVSNWIWIAVAMFIALSLAYTFNRYSTRIYNVKGALLIEEEKSSGGYSGLDQALTGGSFLGSWRNLENEIAILQSYSLNYRVMDTMPELHVSLYTG